MSFHHSHHNINSWYVIFHMTFCSHFSIFADQSERQMCDHWPMRGLILTSGLTGWCDIGPGPPVTEPSVVTQSVCGARARATGCSLLGLTVSSHGQELQMSVFRKLLLPAGPSLAGPAPLSLCLDLTGPNSISAATTHHRHTQRS